MPADGAVAGRRGGRSAPPSWRSSTTASGEPARAGQLRAAPRSPPAGSSSISAVSPTYGIGSSGSWCRRTSAGAGTIANVSISGRERAQRLDHGRVALDGAVDHHDRAAADRLRDLRQRRQLHDPERGRDVVGRVGGPLRRRPCSTRSASRPVPDHEAGVDLGQRVEAELERGDDAEVAAAAAQRPEQLGVVVGVGADELAVGGDELDRGQAVGLQAVAAGEPAHAAAERVAGDADVGRGAVQRDQAVRGGGVDDVLPQRRRRRRGRSGASASISTPPMPEVLTQHRAAQVAERAGVVAGRLAPRRAGPRARARAHDLGDLARVGRVGDGGGALVDARG